MWIDFNNSFIFAFIEKLRRKLNKTYHLASNLLPRYLGKFECSTVQLCNEAIQSRSDAKLFNYSKCLYQ